MSPTRPGRGYGGESHHADFIKHFTARESQRRDKKRPKPLTAAQRAALREQLKNVQFLKGAYADKTKINIAGILRKWQRQASTFLLLLGAQAANCLGDIASTRSWSAPGKPPPGKT